MITLEPDVPYDEQALLMQLQAGSADAFTQLYQAYAERMYYNVLALVKDGLTAEELVQDIFSRIWQKRETIQIDTNFGAYLFTASRNRKAAGTYELASVNPKQFFVFATPITARYFRITVTTVWGVANSTFLSEIGAF